MHTPPPETYHSILSIIPQVTEKTNPEKRVTIENLEEALDRASRDVNVTSTQAVNIGFKKLKVSNGDINTTKKRVGVLISGSGTNLQALIDRSLRHDSSAEIVLVVSNKAGVKGLERAENVGIPTKVTLHSQVIWQYYMYMHMHKVKFH